jgi:uncharacterized protein YegP (UPF0339 family)
MASKQVRVEVYEDVSGQGRWRIRAKNGTIIGSSGESFARHTNAIKAAERISKEMPGSVVLNLIVPKVAKLAKKAVKKALKTSTKKTTKK